MALFLMMLWLLAVHWVADFVCQTHWQSTNKSKNDIALGRHVASYTLVLACGTVLIVRPSLGVIYALVNGVLHYATDYITSRWTAKLYAKQDWHNFFVVIGLDQLIHHLTLAATLWAVVTLNG